MSKLQIERNGIDVEIAEIANISNKEQLIFGNYDRDLILRTKGTITIQVQNKFFDLLNSNDGSVIGGFKVIYIDDINAQASYPEGALIIETSTNDLYTYHNGQLINLSNSDDPSIAGFVSYAQVQDLEPTQILRALSNLGYYWDGEAPIDLFENQLVFNALLNRHQIYKNGVLQDLYLSLTGGTVTGNTKFQGGLIINALTANDLVNPQTTDFKGLTISTDDNMNGFSLYTTISDNVIQSMTGRPLIFRANSPSDNSFKDVLIVNETGVGVNGLNNPNYDFTVNGSSSLNTADIITALKSQYYTPSTTNYDVSPGFSFTEQYLDESNRGWKLEVDRIWEKNPLGEYNISQHYYMNYVKKGYSIKFSDEETFVEFHDDLGLTSGDILLGSVYDWTNKIQSYIYVILLDRDSDPTDPDPGTTWNATFIGTYGTKPFEKLIKVGNISVINKDLIIDSTKENIKIVNQVTDVNSLFTHGMPDLLEDDESLQNARNSPIYPGTSINSVYGNLNEVTDTEFGLSQNNEFGVYSNNAYIRGKANLNYLKLGIELNWDGSTLTIKDLETIKSRNITGANGLIGGGNLFAADIVISHAAGSWVNKINLGTNNFISNLVVDQYGHITDWVTRAITTTDIPEGTNLYYTDDRVKALFPNYNILTSITQGNLDNWNIGYNNSLTNATFNTGTNVLTLVRPSGNIDITIPTGTSVSNLSLGTLTTTTMPILNSNGTGVTLVAATNTTAGLITADTTTVQQLAGNKELTGRLTLKQISGQSYSELQFLGANNYIRTNNLNNMSINANTGIYFAIAGTNIANVSSDFIQVNKYIKMTGPIGWQGGIMFETSPGVAAGAILANGPNDLTIRPGETNGILTVGYDYNNNKLRLVGPTYLMAQVGSGTRMVTVAADGLISSQAIPTGGSWGAITGNINTQTDLITLLNVKENAFTKGSLLQGTGVIISDGVGRLVGNNTTISIASATMLTLGGVKLWSNSIQTDPAQGIVSMANRTYGVQLNSDGQAVVNVPWIEGGGGGINAVWGSITGSLTSQTDLNNALNSKEPAFSKGSIIQGAGVTISGNLTGRLVGSGDITITATGGGGSSQNLQQTTDIGNQTSNFIKITDSGNAPTGNGLYFNYEASNIAGVISVNRNGSSNPSRIELRDSSIKFFPYSGSIPVLSLDTTAVASAAFAGRVSGSAAVLNNEFVTRKQNHVFATSDYSGNAITPSVNNTNMLYSLLNADNTIVLNNPTGTIDNSKMIIRVRSNATRSISWGSMYRGIGIVLPTTLPANKLMYVGFTGNTTDNKWDVIALQIEN